MSKTKEVSTLGVFTPYTSLSPVEQQIVTGTWAAVRHAYIPRSNFPVGAVLLAQNDQGDKQLFSGCNVENRFFTATICAERNAMTSAVAAGYHKLLQICLVCQNYQGPGASACGLCRQVLVEFGSDADMFNMADTSYNVRKFKVRDLLPAASTEAVPLEHLSAENQRLVRQLEKLSARSYVPYSKRPHAAIVVAANSKGIFRQFKGVSDDNSSYGGSALAETVAIRSARTAGFVRSVTLAVTVDDPQAANPIEGECLQVLREFGLGTAILLVGKNRSVVHSTIAELLPDSFGPESLV